MWQYQAPTWLPGGHLQTIYAAKFARNTPTKPINWTRQRWLTPDQDFIDVDWMHAALAAQKPLLVLFHGLEGSSESHYAKAFAATAKRINASIAIPHFRGCSGEPNLAPRAYHSGDYLEIDWILKRMREQHLGPLYAVGISLGGNALMKWAGEAQGQAHRVVDAVASVCSPLDLTASGHAIGRGLNRWLYTPMFLASMKPRARHKFVQYPGLFDHEAVAKAKNLYEFDQAFTAPLHGFASADDYWRRASAKPVLRAITLPALVINARNDPFIPAASLPSKQEVSPDCTLWQPLQGGHVGFPSGPWPGHVLDLPSAVVDWLQRTH